MQKSIKSIFGSLILFALCMGTGFLALEFVIRQLPIFSQFVAQTPAIYQPHETRGWALKSDLSEFWPATRFEGGGIQVNTDSAGNRQTVASTKPQSATPYRIMILGDSFTFGWGVESQETYASLLQQQLDRQFPQQRFIVTNSGVPGYGPDNEWRTLQEQYETLKPDLVIVGFTENDFENTALGFDYNEVVDGQLTTRSKGPRPPQTLMIKLKKFAYRNSATARVIYHRKNIGKQGGFRKSLDEKPFRGWGLEILRRDPRPEVVEVFEKTGNVLNQMKQFLAERNTQMLLVTLPRSYLVYEQEFTNRLEATDESPDDFWIGRLSEEIEKIGETYQIATLSLRQKFIDADQPREELYIPFDGHWQAAGHVLCAKHLTTVVAAMVSESNSKRP